MNGICEPVPCCREEPPRGEKDPHQQLREADTEDISTVYSMKEGIPVDKAKCVLVLMALEQFLVELLLPQRLREDSSLQGKEKQFGTDHQEGKPCHV